jgi:hypothetical protein
MHKRTTPKIFGHAKQLHRNMFPAEANSGHIYVLIVWAMCTFVITPALAVGARDMQSAITS